MHRYTPMLSIHRSTGRLLCAQRHASTSSSAIYPEADKSNGYLYFIPVYIVCMFSRPTLDPRPQTPADPTDHRPQTPDPGYIASPLYVYSVCTTYSLLRTKLMCVVRAECSIHKFRNVPRIRDDTYYNYKQLPKLNEINLS